AFFSAARNPSCCWSFHSGDVAVVAVESRQHVTTLGLANARVGCHGSNSALVDDSLQAVEGTRSNCNRAIDGNVAGDARGTDVHQRRRKIHETVSAVMFEAVRRRRSLISAQGWSLRQPWGCQ